MPSVCKCGKGTVLGLNLCNYCIASSVKAHQACQTSGCTNFAIRGQLLCYPCGNAVMNQSFTQSTANATMADVQEVLREVVVLRDDIVTLRAVCASLLDLVAEIKTGSVMDLKKTQAAYKEAKAVLGEVSKSEVIKDLTEWEGELSG